MTEEQQNLLTISERIIKAQEQIRILDAIKWTDDVRENFFAKKCQSLPKVDHAYYQQRPLNYNPLDKILEFELIIKDAKNLLGRYTLITKMIEQRCQEYIKAMLMLEARGTPQFADYSEELYGAPNDAFYAGGPKLSDLGEQLAGVLQNLSTNLKTDSDEKIYSALEAQKILQEKLNQFFCAEESVYVEVSDSIVADAAAGADKIRLNSASRFSERDLRYLEVHEGWVHVGTTLNGLRQPYCKFLAKGSPASSVTQEGLAVITEIFTFSSYPARLLKLTNRISAISMAHEGANFLEVFEFFKEQAYSDMDAYNFSMRVFRGSCADGKPFTKDLSYTRGFILIYNFMRLAVEKNLIHIIPMFFVGKTLIDEIKGLSNLVDEGLIELPTYLPPQFKDLSALSAWMSFSLYLNKFDLSKLSSSLSFI